MPTVLDVSVVIPTKNEAAYLPRLLDSLLVGPDEVPREVIVADGESTDGTAQLAAAWRRVRVVDGGGHPGVGRNRGAEVAGASTLLFLDGDTELPPRFLRHATLEVLRRRLEGATVPLRCHGPHDVRDDLLYAGHNAVQALTARTRYAFGAGMCLFFDRRAFFDAGGFDESIVYAEDAELVQRFVRAGRRWGVLRSQHLLVTNRRFVKEGRLRMVSLFLGAAWNVARGRPDRRNAAGYRFGEHLDVHGGGRL